MHPPLNSVHHKLSSTLHVRVINVRVPAGKPDARAVCHCSGCRVWSGGLGQLASIYPAESVSIDGDVLEYLKKEDECRLALRAPPHLTNSSPSLLITHLFIPPLTSTLSGPQGRRDSRARAGRHQLLPPPLVPQLRRLRRQRAPWHRQGRRMWRRARFWRQHV